MRRPSVPRASTAIAVVAAIVAVLAVMFPGLGFGQTSGSHGGVPSDVYMQTQDSSEDVFCADVPADGVTAMPQQFELAGTSHVLAYFTFEWEGLDAREFGVLHLELDGVPSTTSEYEFTAPHAMFKSNETVNGTVMWSFSNVAPGTHTVAVYAAVDDLDPLPGATGQDSDLFANLGNCALTVIVTPAAP